MYVAEGQSTQTLINKLDGQFNNQNVSLRSGYAADAADTKERATVMNQSAGTLAQQSTPVVDSTRCNSPYGMCSTRLPPRLLVSGGTYDTEDDACSMCSCHASTWDCQMLIPRCMEPAATSIRMQSHQETQLEGNSRALNAIMTDVVEGSLALAGHVSVTASGPSSDHINCISPHLFNQDTRAGLGTTNSQPPALARHNPACWTGSVPVSPNTYHRSSHAGFWAMPRRGGYATNNAPGTPLPRVHQQRLQECMTAGPQHPHPRQDGR